MGKKPFFCDPGLPGHELGVSVLEVGAGVSNVIDGDRCSVEPCMSCEPCYSSCDGFANCCAILESIRAMMDGGLCDRLNLQDYH